MIVVDTSALLHALAADVPNSRLVERLRMAGELHAPHLLDVEVLHTLRGLARGGKLSDDRADDVRREAIGLRLIRYPVIGLADRIWQLRHALTAYDATYVALAEALVCPLVTSDAKLAHAHGHHAKIELYAR